MEKLKAELRQVLDKWAQDSRKSLENVLLPLLETTTKPRPPRPVEVSRTESKLKNLRKGIEKPDSESDEETYRPIPLKASVEKASQLAGSQALTDVKKGTGELRAHETALAESSGTTSQVVPMDLEEQGTPATHSEEVPKSRQPAPKTQDEETKSRPSGANEGLKAKMETPKSNTPDPRAHVEAPKAQPKASKPEKSASSESESIDSDVNKEFFGSSSDEDSSKPVFRGLKRTEENLNFLLVNLEKPSDEASLGEALTGLEEMFKGNFDMACLSMLVKTRAPHRLQALELDEIDLKRRVRHLRRSWKEACDRLSSSDGKTEDWQRLEKRLQSSIMHKNDQEVLANLRRIGDSFPNRLTRELKAEMKPLMKAVKQAAQETRHSEVQAKVKSLLGRYAEQLPTDEESKEDHLSQSRQQMNQKLTQITQESKLLAESEERTKRATLTKDIGPTKKRKH